MRDTRLVGTTTSRFTYHASLLTHHALHLLYGKFGSSTPGGEPQCITNRLQRRSVSPPKSDRSVAVFDRAGLSVGADRGDLIHDRATLIVRVVEVRGDTNARARPVVDDEAAADQLLGHRLGARKADC